MKQTLLNLGVICVAFIIGLSINNACADSLDKSSDDMENSTNNLENVPEGELIKLISQLQQKVDALEQRISQLEKQADNSNEVPVISDGGFVVDGIHFGRSGFPDEIIDYVESKTYRIVNGVATDINTGRLEYEYDSKGRIFKYGDYTISYSGRTYTYTMETENETTKSYVEQVFHLK